ncbi:MAG: hypothetical protein V2A76_18765 [Planctomycetota bacterium]
MSRRRRARVLIDGEPVGTLTELQDVTVLQYLESWLMRVGAVEILPLEDESEDNGIGEEAS